MSQKLSPEDIGTPDLRIAGFQLWIYGRQFPQAQDADDGNWLMVTAHCGSSGTSVWAEGAILMTSDIEMFAKQCEQLQAGKVTTAKLSPLEPELSITLETTDRLGHIGARVEITPHNLSQAHRIDFEIDQSHLPNIVRECAAILQAYPVRGPNFK